jgi:hypothetical protein
MRRMSTTSAKTKENSDEKKSDWPLIVWLLGSTQKINTPRTPRAASRVRRRMITEVWRRMRKVLVVAFTLPLL